MIMKPLNRLFGGKVMVSQYYEGKVFCKQVRRCISKNVVEKEWYGFVPYLRRVVQDSYIRRENVILPSRVGRDLESYETQLQSKEILWPSWLKASKDGDCSPLLGRSPACLSSWGKAFHYVPFQVLLIVSCPSRHHYREPGSSPCWHGKAPFRSWWSHLQAELAQLPHRESVSSPSQLGDSTVNFLCIIRAIFVLRESKLHSVSVKLQSNKHWGESDNPSP